MLMLLVVYCSTHAEAGIFPVGSLTLMNIASFMVLE